MRKRLKCPPADKGTINRINQLKGQIDKWVNSDELQSLLGLFGADIEKIYAGDLTEQLQKLVEFSSVWDYRKIQKQVVTTKETEAARWLLEDDDFIKSNDDEILYAADNLGLIDVVEPLYDDYNYIIVLGGARYANLHRCIEAARVIKKHNIKNCSVVALGAMRPISESERYAVDMYAPEAKTEFDALHMGLSHAFNKSHEIEYIQEKRETENVNLSWYIRKYIADELENSFYLVAAPSTDPKHRANSADSYKFFFEKFELESGSKVLLCTSSIYIPYQHTKFFDYDIEHNIQSDMIGVSSFVSKKSTLSKPVNYLQEIRAALMAMEEFVSKYK